MEEGKAAGWVREDQERTRDGEIRMWTEYHTLLLVMYTSHYQYTCYL